MYVAVFPEMVERLGNSVSVAYCVAWLDFRTRAENPGTYVHDGKRWWRVTLSAMATEMGVTEKIARKMIEHALIHEAIESAEHQREGWRDRAKSYTVKPEFRAGPHLPSRASDEVPKRADVPIYRSKETYIQAQAPSIEEQKPKRKTQPAIKLPDDWAPNEAHVAKAKALGVDVEAQAEQMRRWAFAGDHKRKNWNSTFNNFLANAKPDRKASIGGTAEFDRLLAKGDVSGVEALVKERYREPAEFVELSPGERAKAREEDFRRWALERRGNI